MIRYNDNECLNRILASSNYDSNTALNLIAQAVEAIVSGGTVATGTAFEYQKSAYNTLTESTEALGTRSLDANFMIGYQVWVKEDIHISKVQARYTAGVVGSSVVGLYNTTILGLPNDLVFQTSAFNNALTAAQTITLAESYEVAAGMYWVVYNSSSTPTSVALSQKCFSNASSWNAGYTAANNIWFKGLVYSETLPTNAGLGLLSNSSAIATYNFYID